MQLSFNLQHSQKKKKVLIYNLKKKNYNSIFEEEEFKTWNTKYYQLSYLTLGNLHINYLQVSAINSLL